MSLDGGDEQEEEDEEGVRNSMVVGFVLNDLCVWNGQFCLTFVFLV